MVRPTKGPSGSMSAKKAAKLLVGPTGPEGTVGGGGGGGGGGEVAMTHGYWTWLYLSLLGLDRLDDARPGVMIRWCCDGHFPA